MQVKCELIFVEWANQWGWWSKALWAYAIWALVLYWNILFGEQIHDCSKTFLCNKLTYKSPLYALATCSDPSNLISAWLATIVSPVVSALFCIKTSEKVNLLVKIARY